MAALSINSLRSFAIPTGTLVLLIAILTFGEISQGSPEGAHEYFDQVATQIDAIPYKVGDWFGVNLPYTEVEVQMLRPNKMLQRTYQDQTTGQKVSLSIVHCTDVHDMYGHYPPVCYPAHGWTLESSQLEGIQVGDRVQQAKVYVFSRRNRGTQESIRIVSFFVVPNSDSICTDMNTFTKVTKQRQSAGLGAAQVQILTPTSQSATVTEEMVTRILLAIEPAIDSIEKGVK